MISLIIRDLVLSRRIVLPTLSFFADLLKFLKHPNVKFKYMGSFGTFCKENPIVLS